MPAPAIILAINVATRKLVVSNGSLAAFENLPRGAYLTRIYLRQDTADVSPGEEATEAFSATGYDGLRMGLWQTSPGTEENNLTLTDQTQFTYNTDDAANPYFEGYFYTNTDAITSWISGSACKDCFLDISLVQGVYVSSILDLTSCGVENFEILNQTDPGSGMGINMTSATPFVNLPFNFRGASGYYTWAETSPGNIDWTYTPN